MTRVVVEREVDAPRTPTLDGFLEVTEPGTAHPDDIVVRIGRSATQFEDLPALIVEGVKLAREVTADAVIFLDATGRDLGGLRVERAGADPGSRSRWFPLIVAAGDHRPYEPIAHKDEAESHRDRIGDRLLRPENVEPDKQHLIADDRQRAGRVLSLPYRGRVLDVGCSDGTLLFETVQRWNLRDAVGVDVAATAIAEARNAATLARLSDRVTLIEGFIEDLKLADHSFDVISACETLEHVGTGQFEHALRNLMRMLRPGGDFFVTVPNRFPAEAYERQGRSRWAWPAHHQFFSQLSLAKFLERSFDALTFLPLYPEEAPGESIYLICHARGHRQ